LSLGSFVRSSKSGNDCFAWFFPVTRDREAARLPEGIRVYAFGDIHERSDLLKEMVTFAKGNVHGN
jgi:hypothetical protein